MKAKITLLALVAVSILAFASPQSVSAAAPATEADCSKPILGIPTWFNGLVKLEQDGGGNITCAIKSPKDLDPTGDSGLSKFIWRVVLNVIDMALRLVAWIAAGMMIFGGFKMITSDGAADKAAQGRKTLLNAAIGLVIAIGSVGLVNLVMGIIK